MTALLLVLVEWVECNLSRPSSSRGRRHSAEVDWIKLGEVTVIIMELDARSFRPVLRNIRHLLLFCEHLNLHLLLLRKRHKVVKDVLLVTLVHSRSTLLRIFAYAAIPEVELGTVCRTISRIGLWRQVDQIAVAGRSVRPTEISGQFLSWRSRLHRCWLRIRRLGCSRRRCCPTRCTLICSTSSAVTLVGVA